MITIQNVRTFDQWGEVPPDPVYVCVACYVARCWVAPTLVPVLCLVPDPKSACYFCRSYGHREMAMVSGAWAALEAGDKPKEKR